MSAETSCYAYDDRDKESRYQIRRLNYERQRLREDEEPEFWDRYQQELTDDRGLSENVEQPQQAADTHVPIGTLTVSERLDLYKHTDCREREWFERYVSIIEGRPGKREIPSEDLSPQESPERSD